MTSSLLNGKPLFSYATQIIVPEKLDGVNFTNKLTSWEKGSAVITKIIGTDAVTLAVEGLDVIEGLDVGAKDGTLLGEDEGANVGTHVGVKVGT